MDANAAEGDENVASIREQIDQGVRFLQEVWAELRKVHWPTWNETRSATIVVLVVVFFIAGFLGLVDFALSRVVDLVLTPRVG